MERPPLRVLWRESHAGSALTAGLIASFPAALLSGALLFAADAILKRPLGTTLRAVGEVAGSETLVSGAAVHLLISAVFGMVFGLLVAFTAHHIAPVAGAAWGTFYGLLVWLAWFVLVVPWVAGDLAEHWRLALFWHLAWGATLGFFFHFARASERRRHQLSRRPGAGTAPPPR